MDIGCQWKRQRKKSGGHEWGVFVVITFAKDHDRNFNVGMLIPTAKFDRVRCVGVLEPE